VIATAQHAMYRDNEAWEEALRVAKSFLGESFIPP
jgi:hypothetical protein